jgi:hypothetical protein
MDLIDLSKTGWFLFASSHIFAWPIILAAVFLILFRRFATIPTIASAAVLLVLPTIPVAPDRCNRP